MPAIVARSGRSTGRLLSLLSLTGLLATAAVDARAAGATEAAGATATATPAPAATPATAAPDPTAPPESYGEAERSLWATEAAFAASFAARDPDKFASFLADDVVFGSGARALHGPKAVREAWAKMMLDGPSPPFSWRPARAVVSGNLGMSSGPVFDRDGGWTGGFTSTWRRQPDGSWRIVLDGAAPCEAPK
jgi:ketosteroid isomerase-like protein